MISFSVHVCTMSWFSSPTLFWGQKHPLNIRSPFVWVPFLLNTSIFPTINASDDWIFINFFTFRLFYHLTPVSICTLCFAINFPFVFKHHCFTSVVLARSPNQDVFVARITLFFSFPFWIVSLGASSSMSLSNFQLLLIFPTSNDVHCNGNESGTDRQN